MGLPALLLSRTFWYGTAIVCGCLFLIHLGNRYGSNASLVAAYETEIKTKNAEIAQLNAADAVTAATEKAQVEKAQVAFNAAAPTLPKCAITKPMADALNLFVKAGG